MGRYMLFEIWAFYPSGGLEDCTQSSDDLDQMIWAFEGSNADRAYVYDRLEGKNVRFKTK